MLTATNPATGEHLHDYPALTMEQMATRIDQAHSAFNFWRQQGFAERARVLRAVADYMRDHADELGRPMTLEMGKPAHEARGEVLKAAWCAEHYADHAEAYLAPQHLGSDATRSYVQHPPLGPVLGILPWNAPFWLAFRFCAPALMAGNTCLMKHDPHVPACAEAISRCFEAVNAPSGIFQNLPLHNQHIATAIIHPQVRAVSFTGSSAAGAQVAATATGALKPVVLELGGSDPAIVLADADLDAAVEAIALSRIINAGQSCIAAKRIIVEDAVHDTFVERLHAALAALRLGDPDDPNTQVGPLARADLRDNLARQVEESIAAGARCLLGGQMPVGPGFFYPVTLLTEAHNQMPACREETFGPVAVVLRARDADHALALANDTDYGLAASIWTTSERGEALAQDLEAGQVVVNGLVKTDPRLPSGGIKRSGLGRELGPHGILAFVNVQQVWIGPKTE
ncbi:NAD-dependent succinate-semialdehyde dehydrogenase [Motiliproteus sediminis]|uniref:NAD-dependent succinate-semialdehyde dehydrogenase n=1 Tax=Motiliproteus sediminis TaxID=1468178 RepID=UPI001AEF379B|nr:NAD-dependent succinate-semialdehyde dehydrogenase [Motiliproteus sediminis]